MKSTTLSLLKYKVDFFIKKVCNYIMGKFFLAVLRVSIGFIFLWAFLDKVFGLGFATESSRSWSNGVSPTAGYLMNATRGPLAEIFQGMAGSPLIDWLFMLGLLGVGVAFVLGIALRFSAYVGAIMMFLMYLSSFPPTNNPLIDDHIIYALVLLVLANLKAGETLGLGKAWSKSKVVKRFPIFSN